MNRFLIIFFLLSLSFSILPQSSIDKQIQVGLDKIYNFNWQAGFESFNSVIKKNPVDPRGYHYKSVIYLWFYLGNLREENLDSFYLYSDKALELAEKQLAKEFLRFSKQVEVEMVSENKCIVYVPEEKISKLIGKQGKNISEIEKVLGVSVDVRELSKRDRPNGEGAEFDVKILS